MLTRIIVFFIIILTFEFLSLKGLLKFIKKKTIRQNFIRIYACVSLFIILFIVAYYIYNQMNSYPDHLQFRKFFNISAIFILNTAPKMIISFFSIIDDLIIFLYMIFKWLMKRKFEKMPLNTFRKIFLISGIALSVFLFGNIIYGMVWGKNDIEIKRVTITSDKLSQSFDGFKIAQISDLHLGSFKNKHLVENAINLLINEKPDIIMFTGDMVNNEAIETLPFIPPFKKLKPSYGMYSVLGNHDMGDYRRWYNEKEKNSNLKELVQAQEEMGFTMLRNKYAYIIKGNDSIAIVGVDNWGESPFKKYGDLKKAMEGINQNLFTILLSHDTSHWTQEIIDKTNINLTLSGHTHGAQFVINFGKHKFSPVQLKYKNWMGLYKTDNQLLYVNTGLGFIGFSGRIGVKPEITIFTLKAK